MEQYLPHQRGFVSLFLSEKLSKGLNPLREPEKERKMAECVNKVSQEDHIFEGIYYSCLLVIVMSLVFTWSSSFLLFQGHG